MKKQVFRQSALDRLSSPEQLDMTFQVVKPAGWFALSAIIMLLVVLIGWGFYGTVATKVTGQGILLRQGALEEATSPGNGRINSIMVDIDDPVEKGQVIARLAQPDLQHQISELRNRMEILKIERETLIEMGDSKKNLQSDYMTLRKMSLRASLKVGRERADALKEQLQRYKALYIKKYITRSQYLEVKDKYNAALQDILSRREELAQLPMKATDSTSQRKKEKIDMDMRYLASQEKLAALEDRLELETFIISPANGRVLEIFKTHGQVIQAGEALLSVEKTNDRKEPLSVQAYVQPQNGKKISAGMEAQVIPSVVKQEEFGVLLGHVTQVSSFPASLKGMTRILGNDQLAKSLSQGGAPITVKLTLRPSLKTESGYSWSSGDGPPITIQSGTLCTVTVVVKRQAPVTLVLPFLKKFFLGVGEVVPSGKEND